MVSQRSRYSYYSRSPLRSSMHRKYYNPSEAILQRIVYHVETLQANRSSLPYNNYPSSIQAKSRAQYHEDNLLKTLRLVNKNFAKAATPAVFKCIAFFPSRRSQRADMQTLMDILNRDIASHVRTLVIRPQLSNSVDEQWMQCTQFALALPICFEKLYNLRTISIDGSVFLGLDRDSHYVHTSDLLTSLRRAFVKALHNTFLSAPSRSVTGFELDFPIMEGLFQAFTAPTIAPPCTQAFSHLEHLSVTVRHHPEHARFTATTSLPSQQQHYPALKYQDRFWSLVNLASNLRSLRIHCSTILDLDNLRLENLQRLEVLDVARVRCKKEHLLAICSPSRASLHTLRLYEVRLAEGVWADVFLRLKKIPTLVEFGALALTYDMPSPHFARILQPLDPYLEMPRRDDRDAFQELTKSVLQRRYAAGFSTLTHSSTHLNTLPN